MNGTRLVGRDTGEGYRRDAFVGKGRGVAGIHVLLHLHREAQLVAQVGNIVAQLLLAGDAGDKFAHDAADHVQIDVQHAVFELFLVGAVSLGAKQSPFLAAAPDEPQTVAVGMRREMLCDAQQSRGAGHIVVSALGQGCGIIVGGKGDIFVHLSRHIQDDVVRLAGILLLLQRDFRRGHALTDQLYRVFGVDVHAGNPVSVVDIGAQLPLVNVPVGVVDASVIGDEAHSAVFQQIVIHPVAQVAVDHHDFSPAPAQRVGAGIPQIIERRFHFSASGAQIALAGHLHAVRLKSRLPHRRHRHVKGYDLGLQPKLRHLVLQILRRTQFLRTSAGADIGCIRKNLHDLFRIHSVPSFFPYSNPFARNLQALDCINSLLHVPKKPWESLNKSSSAERQVFFSIRAVSEAGNTYSVPPFPVLRLAEKLSLTVLADLIRASLRKSTVTGLVDMLL